MNIFLVSNLGVYRKKDGNRIAKEIENSNNIIEQLSEVLINRKK